MWGQMGTEKILVRVEIKACSAPEEKQGFRSSQAVQKFTASPQRDPVNRKKQLQARSQAGLCPGDSATQLCPVPCAQRGFSVNWGLHWAGELRGSVGGRGGRTGSGYGSTRHAGSTIPTPERGCPREADWGWRDPMAMDSPSIQLLVPAHHPRGASPLRGQPESSLPAAPSSKTQVHGSSDIPSLFPACPVSGGPEEEPAGAPGAVALPTPLAGVFGAKQAGLGFARLGSEAADVRRCSSRVCAQTRSRSPAVLRGSGTRSPRAGAAGLHLLRERIHRRIPSPRVHRGRQGTLLPLRAAAGPGRGCVRPPLTRDPGGALREAAMAEQKAAGRAAGQGRPQPWPRDTRRPGLIAPAQGRAAGAQSPAAAASALGSLGAAPSASPSPRPAPLPCSARSRFLWRRQSSALSPARPSAGTGSRPSPRPPPAG